MAKQHRATVARSRKTGTRKRVETRPRARRSAAAVASQKTMTQAVARPRPAPAPVPAPPKKPAYYEAIAVYETGVRALQRHDFAGAAEHFRSVLQRYPDERELVERATLYLRVCERETANRATGPRTPAERIYAATLALNAGNADLALSHLRQALAEDPNSDHGSYIMAVALSDRGQYGEAAEFLRQAIALNPDNRSLARQDPDLAVLRETDAGRQALTASIQAPRKRQRR